MCRTKWTAPAFQWASKQGQSWAGGWSWLRDLIGIAISDHCLCVLLVETIADKLHFYILCWFVVYKQITFTSDFYMPLVLKPDRNSLPRFRVAAVPASRKVATSCKILKGILIRALCISELYFISF